MDSEIIWTNKKKKWTTGQYASPKQNSETKANHDYIFYPHKVHTNMYNTTMGDNGIISGGHKTWDNNMHILSILWILNVYYPRVMPSKSKHHLSE